MLRSKYMFLLMSMVLAVMFSSCAHTKFISTWKDPEYQGYPKKILVLALARNPTVRTLLENQMVEQLQQHGLSAMASHGLLPDDLVVKKEPLLQIVNDHNVDAIFIARAVSRKALQTLRPGEVVSAGGGYVSEDGGFVASFMATGYMPATYEEEDVAMEMAVFNVSTRKRIWSAIAKTYIWNTPMAEVKPGVERIIEALVTDKVIPNVPGK